MNNEKYLINNSDLSNKNFTDVLPMIIKYSNNAELLNKFQKCNSGLLKLYYELYQTKTEEEFLNEINNMNEAQYNLLMKARPSMLMHDGITKLIYNLGGFNYPITETRITKSGKQFTETIDYSQIVCEFIKGIYQYYLYGNQIDAYTKEMKLTGFKPEFTKFFINKSNFEKIIDVSMDNNNFISSVYNDFEKIQKTHTANKGKQRQLAPTVEYFVNYYTAQLLKESYNANYELVDVVSEYFFDVETIKLALEIDNKRKQLNTPDNILSLELKEQPDFDKIDENLSKCEVITSEILNNLIKETGEQFTYEWLKKSDPANYILGKLCNCCAHLKGAGGGIMEASITNPNVQNLVMRNKHNEIIAKSTLYLNREEQYGVFNNVEISTSVRYRDYKNVFKSYMRGVTDFVKQYNIENPQKKLKILTVGQDSNALIEEIVANLPVSEVILKSLDYRNMEYNWFHDNDSSTCQYVVYEDNEVEK